jgi:hypothetical protein
MVYSGPLYARLGLDAMLHSFLWNPLSNVRELEYRNHWQMAQQISKTCSRILSPYLFIHSTTRS